MKTLPVTLRINRSCGCREKHTFEENYCPKRQAKIADLNATPCYHHKPQKPSA